MVGDGLLVEQHAGEDEVVDLGDADLAQLERPERRPQVPPDDALVVLAAALPDRPLVDPVVADFVEGLVGWLGGAEAPSDLLNLELVLAQLERGVGVFVVDLGVPAPIRVDPADAPLAELPDRRAMARSYRQPGAGEPATPPGAVAGQAASRATPACVGSGARWPGCGLEKENADEALWAKSASSRHCGARI